MNKIKSIIDRDINNYKTMVKTKFLTNIYNKINQNNDRFPLIRSEIMRITLNSKRKNKVGEMKIMTWSVQINLEP
jgi:hypothetical protein